MNENDKGPYNHHFLVSNQRLSEDDMLKLIVKSDTTKLGISDFTKIKYPSFPIASGFSIPQLWYDLSSTWEQIKPFCEFLGMSIGATSFCVKIINFIKKKMNRSCHTIFDDIFSKDSWKITDMVNEFELSRDECKKLLKLFQFKWNRHKREYIRTLESQDVISMLKMEKEDVDNIIKLFTMSRPMRRFLD